ncbi:hypothetical protein NPIL_85424 [Nephila pilipes]|uniref:Uncharacterized protein n=1 Tax=Nephila pilipes TaxID=299642 RepID=A0A8X6QJ04_NEPPI|nr:hypothetical protein NPIL_85424 [Nephila pilipes]
MRNCTERNSVEDFSEVMALQDRTKISLAAQYDDLCRYNRVLTMGCEKEFIDFSEIQLNLKRKLKQTEDKIQELKKRNTALEIEKRKHEYQINNSKKRK